MRHYSNDISVPPGGSAGITESKSERTLTRTPEPGGTRTFPE